MIQAILQARMSSSRLPGKVLRPLLGVPMLLRQVERIRRATTLDALVIATSTDRSDDALEQACTENGLSCFRGALDDVLDRFYQVARERHPEYVVRLTGDCPVADPAVIDAVVHYAVSGGFDYTSNTLPPTFPDGLDVEVFTFQSLETAWREARLPSQREHVTPFIHQQPERFRIGNYAGPHDLSHLRWTVDEALDFELIRQIYESLYPAKPDFNTDDILALLDRRPELKTLNTAYGRNEGYQRSLAKDVTHADHKKEKTS